MDWQKSVSENVARESYFLKNASKSDLYRKIPSVDELVRACSLSESGVGSGQGNIRYAARAVLNIIRNEIAAGQHNGESLDLAVANLPTTLQQEVDRERDIFASQSYQRNRSDLAYESGSRAIGCGGYRSHF